MRYARWIMALALAAVAISFLQPVTPGRMGTSIADAATGDRIGRAHTGVRPLAFTKNEGQWDERVLYRTTSGGATIWFSREGITYQFVRGAKDASLDRESLDPSGAGTSRMAGRDPMGKGLVPQEYGGKVEFIHAKFVNPNPNFRVEAGDLQGYKCNFFHGNDPSKWRTDVPNYSGIIYRDIYPGIDLHLDGRGGTFHTFCATTRDADLSQVLFEIDDRSTLSAGVSGDLSFDELLAAVFPSGWMDRRGSTWDAAGASINCSLLEYSAYLGGSSGEEAYGVAVDNAGSAYITGGTSSSDFPLKDTLDGTVQSGDVFVTKLTPAGDSIIHSTFVGGYRGDLGYAIAVDSDSNCYVAGKTGAIGATSNNFPTTDSAYDRTYNGGIDVFVFKLSASGNNLLYSTYLGGGLDDTGYGIAIDAQGNIYVTGHTNSSGSSGAKYPITGGAYDAILDGNEDVFVTKVIPAPNQALGYSTFLGGNEVTISWSGDRGKDIVVDIDGCAYVTGYTTSENFPTKPATAVDTSHGAPNAYDYLADAFVTKINASGSALVYSSFLGGASIDQAFGIDIDDEKNAYVTGLTSSSDFPTDPGAYDRTLDGSDDVFVTKLDPTGESLVYSTLVGGDAGDHGGQGIAVDTAGLAYVTGQMHPGSPSNPFPTTYDTCQDSGGGEEDTYVFKLSSKGNGLAYSTYIAGIGKDWGRAVALDNLGSVYVTGITYSYDFPTQGDLDSSLGGGTDAFVMKFALACDCPHQGDMDGNNTVDPYDLNALIDALYYGGPDTTDVGCRTSRGDFNNDFYLDGLDQQAMIDYLFYQGPGPCNPCDPIEESCVR